ncbi:MAG: CRISPR-associated endonuclease Cas2 [Kiritimatiellia bacterium]
MFVLVTYDVNTETPEGRRRLRTVAKICTNYGTRVQNSVFECVVDSVLLMEMKVRIGEVIDPEIDSVRYYNLGKHGRDHVEHVGAKPGLNVEGVLIL